MNQIIDFTKFGTSQKQQRIEETKQYRQHLLNIGMEELTQDEFLAVLKELNYKIDKSMCNIYYNNYNSMPYNAYGLSYKDLKTKLSFAHYTQGLTNADNLEKLQNIRQHYFVFDGKNIWDL